MATGTSVVRVGGGSASVVSTVLVVGRVTAVATTGEVFGGAATFGAMGQYLDVEAAFSDGGATAGRGSGFIGT